MNDFRKEKMNSHVNIIAVLWIVTGIFGLFLAFTVFGILFGITFIPDIDYEAVIILRIIGLWGSLFIAILSAPELIAGIGLMKKKEWARILTLIVSFLNLVFFPFWTILGIYSIIILLKEETIQLFKH
jgi:hypothetical protein